LTHLGGVRDVWGDTAGARVRFDEALTRLAATEPGALRATREAEARLQLGHAHRREGDLEAARSHILEAITRYRSLGRDEGLTAALYELAVVEMFSGRRAAARASFDEGLSVAQRSKSRVLEAAHTTARGCLMQEQGDLREALAAHAAAARIFAELGSRYREASALFYLATTYLELDQLTEALAVIGQARARGRSAGAPRYDALMSAVAATALATLGRFEEADGERARADQARERVPDEPALDAAVAVHGWTVDVRAGRREGDAALAEAEGRVAEHSSDDSRFALRVLTTAVRGSGGASARDELEVWPAGAAFRPPSSDARVPLPEGSPLRRILAHLVARRLDAAGEVVSIDEVIAVGWPDEKMGVDAALNRAHVALSALRRKGLRDILVRSGGGYALSRAVVVRRAVQAD